MNFKDASKIIATIQATDEPAFIQSGNRAKINELFNGSPLLSPSDAKKMNLKVNCNLGEAPVLGQHGRRQYQTAFLSRNNFFSVKIPDAPPEKRSDWESFVTRMINKPLKKSLTYFELQRSKWASVLLHGYAPCVFPDTYCVLPEFVALEDFRVPTDAMCDFSNWSWFAIRKPYTEGELSRKVFGKHADPGWNKKEIQNLLDTYHDQNWETGEAKWADIPERMAEIIKQNGGFYAGDAVPTIPLFHFYFLDDRNPKKPEWRMRVVPDTLTLSAPSEFMFDDGNTCWAKDIKELLQMQFGDLNNKPPFLVHSIRSMGFLLMEPIFHSNLLQTRFIQHVHEHMNAWIRVQDVAGKARAQKIDLYDRGVLPDGVTIVPAAERHNINPNLVEMAIDRMQELKQQASVSYTQDTEPGQKQDETATAVMARVSTVNAMMSGLLLTARQYETFACEEIARRFCIRRSDDRMAQDFQKACREFGIPSVFVNSELWDIEVEMPLGNGNPTMEMAQANLLMQNIAAFDPTAQADMKHEWLLAVTGDPKKAEKWAPMQGRKGPTNAQEHAEMAFSTLMLGVPVQPREGLPIIDQIGTILGLMAGVIGRIEKTGNMARQDEIIGLQTAAQYIAPMIQQLSQDKAQERLARQFEQMLGKLMQTVKGFEQRLMEQQKKAAQEQNGNGHAQMLETAAKVQGMQLQSQTKAGITERNAQQKLAHKDRSFAAEQRRKTAQMAAEEQRKNLATVAEQQRKDLETKAEVKRRNYAAFNTNSEK